METKWICRTPQEITILILRILFGARRETTEDSDVSSLRASLGFLRYGQWMSFAVSRRPNSNTPSISPLVPSTFCFDETSKRLGISKPTWPEGRFKASHPWYGSIIKVRDEWVANKLVQEELAESQGLLDEIIKSRPMTEEPSQAEWDGIRLEIQRKTSGKLQHYEDHVWQATDSWAEPIPQCWRCRCVWNAKLVEENGAWTSKDTKPPKHRKFGPCAESCLHAEETEETESRATGSWRLRYF